MNVRVIEKKDFGGNTAKVDAACSILRIVFSDPAFKEAVHNFTHDGKRLFYFEPGETSYLNEKVYQIIEEGKETPNLGLKNTVDLFLRLEPKHSDIDIGGSLGNSIQIYTHANWYESFNSLGYAKHLAHEWTHKLGFTHGAPSRFRMYSVPYGIATVVGKVALALKLHEDKTIFIP